MVSRKFRSPSFRDAQKASRARNHQMLEIQQRIPALGRQITEHHMETNAEIMSDNHLTLLALEEYANP